MTGLPCAEESMMICSLFSRFDTIPECDRRTDRIATSLHASDAQ